jgi:hypothetical protein
LRLRIAQIGPPSSDIINLQHLVPIVVDNLHGNLAGIRLREGAALGSVELIKFVSTILSILMEENSEQSEFLSRTDKTYLVTSLEGLPPTTQLLN